MKAGGGDDTDPITTKMLTGLRRAEFPGPLSRQRAKEEEEGEVELSLGLSVGGNKRKDSIFVSDGESANPNRKCRARMGFPKADGGIRNPVGILNPSPVTVMPTCAPANGSGFSSMVNCRAPSALSDSTWSLPKVENPNYSRSLNPNIKPNPNHGVKRSARMKRTPSLCGGSPATVSSSSCPQVRERSSSSEDRSNNSSPNAADQKPREQAIHEAVLKPGAQAAAAAGPSGTKVEDNQMPRVMARGADGGITSGFLYRYNEREVSIVCVCHGSSFSPAGFVRHAGGRESSHPLRQITVVPS